MGKIEDLMVYTKLIILVVISFVLINNATATLPNLVEDTGHVTFFTILLISSVMFVAYEGFQLVINATNEMETPKKNIPRAIYSAIAIYVVIAIGALVAIPFGDIIANQEYALAAGAGNVLGHWGTDRMILGTLLATSSAISGTVFGSSRLIAVVAKDGYLPAFLARRPNKIPIYAVFAMSLTAMVLVATANLRVILEFSSMTFMLVSFLMALANFKMRRETGSSIVATLFALVFLAVGARSFLFTNFRISPNKSCLWRCSTAC